MGSPDAPRERAGYLDVQLRQRPGRGPQRVHDRPRPAGTVSVFSTADADFVLDITGYFS